jgi:hypothetical protein
MTGERLWSGRGAEALGGAGFGFGGFFFAAAGRSGGFERAEEAHGGCSDFLDCRVERVFVRFRRFMEAADLPDELKRSRANFFGGNGRIEVKKRFDVSTHGLFTRLGVTCLKDPKYQRLRAKKTK